SGCESLSEPTFQARRRPRSSAGTKADRSTACPSVSATDPRLASEPYPNTNSTGLPVPPQEVPPVPDPDRAGAAGAGDHEVHAPGGLVVARDGVGLQAAGNHLDAVDVGGRV